MRFLLPISRLAVIAAALLGPAEPGRAEPAVTYQITVEAGTHPRHNTPVRAEVLVPADWADKAQVTLTAADGTKLPAQLATTALLDAEVKVPAGMCRRVVWWLLPKLAANESAAFQATIAPGTATGDGFSWTEPSGKQLELLAGKRPVLRYMYGAYGDKPAKLKPFHHLLDPATGQRLVTKGPEGNVTYQRGLFYGYGRCTFEGGTCGTWSGDSEQHTTFLSQTAGPVLARHCVAIDWNAPQGKPFCAEEREAAAYAVGSGTLVEWSSRLRSTRGTVTLDGDAFHAGFQFRAHDGVYDRPKETYFLRADGRGKLGEERNGATVTNLPWNAMSFMLDKSRYTVVYLDSPRNPKPSFYLERLYGRFGSWVGKQTLKEGEAPLWLTYRLWLQEGEMTGEQAASLSVDFAEPPRIRAVLKQ